MKEAAMPSQNVSAEAGWVREEDLTWIASVLNLVPKAVYGGHKIATLNGEHESKKGKAAAKSFKAARKMGTPSQKRAKKILEVDSDEEDDDPERASTRDKLRAKILQMRNERKADDETHISIRADRKRKREEKTVEREKEVKKMRREQKSQNTKKRAKGQTLSQENYGEGSGEEPESGTVSGEGEAQNVALETSRLSGFSEAKKKHVKRRKLSGGKLRELQIQLQTATKEKELKEKAAAEDAAASAKARKKPCRNPAKKAKQDESDTNPAAAGSEGVTAAVADREMEKALQRAQGIDIRDDVQKLKKSIRREKRKTEKSKEEWGKRVAALEKEKVVKQGRREKHLKERKENKGKSGKGKSLKKTHKKRS